MKKILTAAALAATLAAPAQADTADGIKGLMLGIILAEVLKTNNHTQPTTTVPAPQPVIVTRNPQNCGYFQNIEYQGAYVIDTKFNRCTGELISQEVRPRY